jgi:hypothetical protein
MTELENDEFGPTSIELLEIQAKQVNSKEEFLKILVGIAEICMKDDESWERRMIHFVRVIEDFLKHDLVETPRDQNWKWLAKLFLIGAFEN